MSQPAEEEKKSRFGVTQKSTGSKPSAVTTIKWTTRGMKTPKRLPLGSKRSKLKERNKNLKLCLIMRNSTFEASIKRR